MGVCFQSGKLRLVGVVLAVLVPAGVSIAAGAGGKPIVIYSNDFAGQVGPEWSHPKTAVTPKGGRKFLGQFANDRVRLTLSGLPPHRYVRLSFELFVIRTWDGNATKPGIGPDVWAVRVQDGPELLRCTFANTTGQVCDKQTFPDEFPGPSHDRKTGAAESNTLGYVPNDGVVAGDAVYRMRLAFRHTASELTLIFSGAGLQGLQDESWGLDSVKVELLPDAQPLGAEQLREHWQALAGADPVKAFEALWALAASGDRAAAFAVSRLRPPDLDEAKAQRLVRQLDSEQWSQREAASRQLREFGQAVAPILRETLKGKVGPEVEARVRELLAELSRGSLSPEARARSARISRLLEVIGSEKSLEALGWLCRREAADEVRCPAAWASRRVAGRLSDGLLRQAETRARKLDFDAARKLCGKALALAKGAGSLAVADIEAQLARLDKRAGVQAALAQLKARLQAKPDDRAVRERLIRTYAVELDSPPAAAALLDARCDPTWRKYLPLATRRPGELSAAECLDLARWYRDLAKEAGALGRPAMLQRAGGYYAQYARRLEQSVAEAKSAAKAIQGELGKLGQSPWISLLDRIEPHTHTVAGQWTWGRSALRVSSSDMARLTIPVAPRGDYELTAEFIRTAGANEVNFILPVGDTGVVLTLHAADGTPQLQNVGGRELVLPKENAPHLTNGKMHRLHVLVRQQNGQALVRAEFDGKEFVRWKGPARSLAVNESWAISHKQALGLGVHHCAVVYYGLHLRMLSGQAKMLRLQPQPQAPPSPDRFRLRPVLRDINLGGQRRR